MKKLIALLLALMMVLVCTAALAAGGDDGTVSTPPITPGQNATAEQTITIKKVYTFNVKDNATIPADTIKFTVGEGKVTEATTVTTAPAVTIDDIAITEAAIGTDTTKEYPLKINLSAYTEVGVYEYEVTETIGKVVGVTYTPNVYTLKITVIRDDKGNLVIGGIALREKNNTKKVDAIENSFGGGNLTVKKTVTGNMGDRSKEWTIKVTFTADEGMTVGNTIKYTPVGADTATSIAAGWTGSKEVELTLKHNESVTFENLPAGIKYTVVETNPETSYDEPTGEVKTATALAAKSAPTVTITNNKNIDVDTGVALDFVPYVLIMALVLAGVALRIYRRRKEY